MMEFVFEESPWEKALADISEGETLSAVHLLTLLEEADEEETESFLDALSDKGVVIDVSSLPKTGGNGDLGARLQLEEKLVAQGALMQSLPKEDPLRLYLQEVAQLPAVPVTVTPKTPAEKEIFTNAMLGNMVELAKEYVGMGVLLLDLIQEANLGLWQGIQSCEGADITDHCIRMGRYYLSRAVFLQARSAGVGQMLRQAMEDYRSVDEKLLTELGRNPTVEEMAQALHLSVESTETIAQMLENARTLNRVKMPAQTALPQEEDQAVEDTAYFQMRQRIQELLSVLSAEDAKLLTLRYGLEGGMPMKPEQVAQKMGITVDRVLAAESAALEKLRTNHS